jgi:hypothetical protein
MADQPTQSTQAPTNIKAPDATISDTAKAVAYHTHNGVDAPLVATSVISGSGAPSQTPKAIGQIYVDTSGLKVYIATGISSSADFTIVN